MSYKKPVIKLINNPVGIDAIIQDIQIALNSLGWLKYSFGRAWFFNEVGSSGKIIKKPKCYIGQGEYYNVLPNDNIISQSFFIVKQAEKYIDYDNLLQGNKKSRDLSIIFWMKLTKLNSIKDSIFTEELKNDVEFILMMNENITIQNFFDEKADDIFAGFTIDDIDTQYLMHPYAGMRFDINVQYYDLLCNKDLNIITVDSDIITVDNDILRVDNG